MGRVNTMFACFAGCVIAALIGLLALLKFDMPILAMISAGLLPAIACWLAGMTNKKQLAKIAGYAAIGWMLTFMLQPAIAQTTASHVRRIMTMPLLGHDWHIPASFTSTLLALIGVYFATARVEPVKQKPIIAKSKSPDTETDNASAR